MARRLTNDLLLLLVLAQVVTGLVGWAFPGDQVLPVYGLHRALGVAVLLVILHKQTIARASLARRLARSPRDRSTVWGLVAATALLGSVAIGLAWTFNLVSFDTLWGYSPLNVHVGLGIGLLPFVAWHVLRRWRLNTAGEPVPTRRSLLRLGSIGVGAFIGWRLLEPRSPVTGSKHAGSLSGNSYPVTIWLFDQVPVLDRDTWRLDVGGQVLLGYEQLINMLPERQLRAVLDCTSGWWSEQVWSGVSMRELLATLGLSPTARSVSVTSVTGHGFTFPIEDLDEALLVTHVGGEPLTPGHGFPVRLAVPGRRGYQWVKWVDRISVR
jgi:hypothetical protein